MPFTPSTVHIHTFLLALKVKIMHEVGREHYQGSKIHLGQTRNFQVYGQAARGNSSPLEILFCKCMEQSHFSPMAQALFKKVLRHGQSCAYPFVVTGRKEKWSAVSAALFSGCLDDNLALVVRFGG
jgi:hypothetical protein